MTVAIPRSTLYCQRLPSRIVAEPIVGGSIEGYLICELVEGCCIWRLPKGIQKTSSIMLSTNHLFPSFRLSTNQVIDQGRIFLKQFEQTRDQGWSRVVVIAIQFDGMNQTTMKVVFGKRGSCCYCCCC